MQEVFAMDGVLFQFYILNDGKVLNVPLFMADNLDSVTNVTIIIIFMNNIPWDSDGTEC